MRKILFLAACLLAMSPGTRSAAAQNTGVIAGTVVDPDGKPLADVDVSASADNARAH